MGQTKYSRSWYRQFLTMAAVAAAIASLFYVYYERTDVEDKSTRPLTISFNGRPGSAAVRMHLGYTGPYRIRIDAEGLAVPPCGNEAWTFPWGATPSIKAPICPIRNDSGR